MSDTPTPTLAVQVATLHDLGLGAIAITSWYLEQRASRSATELTAGAETAAEAPRVRPDRNLPASDAIAQARTQAAPAPSAADVEARQKGLLDVQIEAIEGAFAQRDKHMAALRLGLDSARPNLADHAYCFGWIRAKLRQ